MDGITSTSRNKDGFIHPANRVGKWAYFNRFPQSYSESAFAYAGIDADAHARGGWWGVIGVCVFLVLARLAMVVLRAGEYWGTSAYYAAVYMLGIMMPHASLQAIFVSQGLAIYLFLMLIARFERKNIGKV